MPKINKEPWIETGKWRKNEQATFSENKIDIEPTGRNLKANRKEQKDVWNATWFIKIESQISWR